MVGRLSAVAALALVLGTAFAPVLFGGRTLSSAAWAPGVLPSGPVGADRPAGPPPVRDVEGASWVDEPAPYLVHRALSAGRLPLWNEREGLGMPLLGNPNMGALSPLQLPVNLAPSPLTQDLVWLGRALLLGVFTFALARELGTSWLGSIGAAIALMLSGQTVEWIEHHPLNTDVFVPAALCAALSIERTGRRGVAWLALAVGAGLLGVKPQSAVVAGLFGVPFLLAARADRAGSARGKLSQLGGAWLAGLLLGAGIAAVALLPFWATFEGASGLVRAGRTTQSEWTLPLDALSSLGGRLATMAHHWPTGGASRDVEPFGGLPYAGLTVVIAAALGFWQRRRSWVSAVLLLTVLVEILRIHGALPISLAGVPVLGSIQFVKYCFPLYLSLSLLAGRALDTVRRPVATAGLIVIAAELVWLAPRDRAVRVEPYAPAPWVAELRRLTGQRPGRMVGPVDLAPPLVSAALGLRDLRSVDVLTPNETYDFVSRLVAPSRGVTWVLADPDPLLAATGPAANIADLRWIVARRPLSAEALPAAVRVATTSRRLTRLFGALEGLRTETRRLGGGLHDGGGDRRFHWTCETPCRFEFELRHLPEHFVAGFAAPAPVGVRVRLGVAGRAEVARSLPLGRGWQDVWWSAGPLAGRGGTIRLAIESDAPATVFLGGVGPSPAPALEAFEEGRELASRAEALGRLKLRWRDDVAHVYENPSAMGEAAFAARVISVPDRERALACAAEAPGERIACLVRGRADSRELPSGGRGRVDVRASTPETLRLTTEASARRVLLVSRLFDPAWRAAIDDAPAQIWLANGALMAVEVPGGAHEVVLTYAPSELGLGAGISLASLAVVGALLGRRRFRGSTGLSRRRAARV